MYNKKKVFCITMVLMITIGTVLGNGAVLASFASALQSESVEEAGSVNSGEAEIVTVNEESNGKKIELTLGQILSVELEGAGDEAEFNWELEEKPENILNYYNSYKDTDRNKECWVFNAIGQGSSEISFKSHDKSFSVFVTVKERMGVMVIGKNYNGLNLKIRNGQKLLIALDANSTTGYSWNVTGVPDTGILRETSNYYVPYPVPEGWCGGGGIAYTMFDTVDTGSTAIELKYAHSWEISDTTEDTFSLNVTVVDSNSKDSFRIITISENADGKEFIIPMGDILKVELDIDTSVNTWELSENSDKNVLKHISSHVDTELAKYFLVFTAIGEGTSIVKLKSQNKFYMIMVGVKQPDGVVVIDERYDGKEVVLRRGDQLKMALQANNTTGYQWYYDKVPNTIVINSPSNEYVSYPVPPGWCGGGGVSYWYFKAMYKGTTEIGFSYLRSLGSSENPDKTFSVKIRVIDETAPSPTPYADYPLYGYVKADLTSPDETINKDFKVEVVETGAYTYTDENGKFTFSHIIAMDYNTYTLKITKENYLERTISAKASKLTGTPVIMWAGDISVNGKQDNAINISDIMAVVKAFNTSSEDMDKFDSNFDLNCDNVVNIVDIMIVASRFNKTSADYGVY